MNQWSIDLDTANKIVAGALLKGRELDLRPISVAVLDPGGHLVAFAREDGSSNLRPQIAVAKAMGTLALGVSSRVVGEMAEQRPTFINAAALLSPGGIIPAAGAYLIKDADGRVLGAVGVTGDNSDNDEACAAAGISAAGLTQG